MDEIQDVVNATLYHKATCKFTSVVINPGIDFISIVNVAVHVKSFATNGALLGSVDTYLPACLPMVGVG